MENFTQGNRLDLSLNNLTIVPVKDIKNNPKITRLDLSCNKISYIPDEFCSCVQLVDIDLSKNLLSHIPSSIGNLIRLQYLDLSENNIADLPTSFSQLVNLKYLDLKGNPINDKLKPVAGFCLDKNDCQSCARKVVAHFKNIQVSIDKKKQKEESIKKASLDKIAEKEQKEKDAMRLYKKLEKEKHKLFKEQKRLQENWDTQFMEESNITEFVSKQDSPTHKPFKFSVKTLALIIFAILFIGMLFYALWIIGVGPSAYLKSDL